MYITKKYLKSNLTLGISEVFNRMKIIEIATKGLTLFEEQDNFIIRKSLKIEGYKPKYLTKEQLEQLAKKLDYFYELGLIHGDLHFKNLIVSNNEVHIIDWEPSLKQLMGNMNTLMYTAPWIDPEDKKNRILTLKTDLMCFYKIKTNKKFNYFLQNDWLYLKEKIKNVKMPFTSLNQEKLND